MSGLEWAAVAVAIAIAYLIGHARGRIAGLREFKTSMEEVAQNMLEATNAIGSLLELFRQTVRTLRGESDG